MKKRTITLLSIVAMLIFGLYLVPYISAQDDEGDATEEVTEVTEEATEEMTEEATDEPTDEATEEATDEPTDEATEEATDEATEEDTSTATNSGTYVIQPGDTLYSIATSNGTTVTALASANNIVNPSRIFWGQTLVIPDGDATGGPAATATPEPDDTATPEPTEEPDEPDDANTETYTVRTGDNLYRISLLYNTSIERLVELNDIQNANVIFTGQVLTVPAL